MKSERQSRRHPFTVSHRSVIGSVILVVNYITTWARKCQDHRVLWNFAFSEIMAWVWVAQRLLRKEGEIPRLRDVTRASPAKDKASRRSARNDRTCYSRY